MYDVRPSRVPVALAVLGLGLVAAGAFLPWVHLWGHHPVSGLGGGWIVAHLRGHFTDGAVEHRPVAFEFGADALITLAVAIAAIAVAAANWQAREQRYDRLQFLFGALVAGVALYNVMFIFIHASEHFVHSDPGGDSMDSIGSGLWLTMIGGIVIAAGALLGNTPEFDLRPRPRERADEKERA